MAANGTGSLMFIDDVTAGRSSRMKCIGLSAHIQPNAAKLIGWCLTVQMETPKTYYENNPSASQGKEMAVNGSFFNGQVSHLTSTQLSMFFTY